MGLVVSAAFSAKASIETAIRTDTGANGLNDSDGTAFVRGLYYKIPPATTALPHISFNIIGPNQNASALQVHELTIIFEVYVAQVRQAMDYAPDTGTVDKEHHFGFRNEVDAGESIINRLRTLFQGATLASNDSWTFSPLDRVDGDAGAVSAERTRFVEVYRCVASKALSDPASVAGVITGTGISIAGTASSGSFVAYAPFAFRYSQTQDLSDVTLVNAPHDQFSHGSSSASLSLAFIHTATNSPPVIPTGRLSALILTVATGKTFRLASGGWAHVRSMSVGASRRSFGAAEGNYDIQVSGPTTPEYAVPMYFTEGGSPL